jgi:hypothetical protein
MGAFCGSADSKGLTERAGPPSWDGGTPTPLLFLQEFDSMGVTSKSGARM